MQQSERCTIAYITLDTDGKWGVAYVSHATGEPQPAEIIGSENAKLKDLVPPLEKFKSFYVDKIKGLSSE